MRQLFALVALALVACGAAPPPPPPQSNPGFGRAISVEWRAEPGDGTSVEVTLVVDNRPIAIGPLDAAAEDAVGPTTCGLRAAHPLRTELLCGVGNYYSAELANGELVISVVRVEGERPVEVKRIPANGEGLAVRPYQL